MSNQGEDLSELLQRTPSKNGSFAETSGNGSDGEIGSRNPQYRTEADISDSKNQDIIDKRDVEDPHNASGDTEDRTGSLNDKVFDSYKVGSLSTPSNLTHTSSSPAILPSLSKTGGRTRSSSIQRIPSFQPKNRFSEVNNDADSVEKTAPVDVQPASSAIGMADCTQEKDVASDSNDQTTHGQLHESTPSLLKKSASKPVEKRTRFIMPKLSMETEQQKEELSKTSKFANMTRSGSRTRSYNGHEDNVVDTRHTNSSKASVSGSPPLPPLPQSVLKKNDKQQDSEQGVVMVRSSSSSNQAPLANLTRDHGVVGDNSSILSADSQEIYALRQMGYAIASRKTVKTITSIPEKPAMTSAILQESAMSRKTATTSAAVYDTNSARTEKTDDVQQEKNSVAGSTYVSGTAKEVSFDSDDSQSQDDRTMDSYFRYNESEDTASDDDDCMSNNDSSTLDLGTLNLRTSSFANSNKVPKSDMSEVSGSFDDDEILLKGKGLPDEEKEKLEQAQTTKKTKRTFRLGKGLGKKKGDMKTVKTEVKDGKDSKGGLLGLKKFKRTKMKKSAVRAPKKVIKKKKGVQLRTIRLKGGIDQDDIVPRKGDPGVKVMKVSKLTTQGYVSAEFTSLDPNNTPLHIACLTHYPKRFILDVLLKAEHLQAISAENSSGELPIHYAVMDKMGVDPDVFEALIEKFPESVDHKNVDRSLPIHVACQVGAPSAYSIERLLEINPDFALAQNDLRVPLYDADFEDESSGWCDMMCLDWFQGNKEKYIRFETGWTPLHLGAVNGAPPEVIEAIIDANPECLLICTNKKRTAMECAKNVIIKALLNDVELYKVENTFNAIEVMQSYEKEIRLKEELALKSGIVKSAIENFERYGNWWMTATDMLPNREKLDEIFRRDKGDRFDNYDYDDDWGDEKGMTNLHRAILKKADPEVVHAIIEEWPECLDIMSSYDRTPMTCAKQIIIRGLLNEDPVSTFSSTFVSLQVMQAFADDDDDEDTSVDNNTTSQNTNRPKDRVFDATEALSKADVSYLKTRNRQKWGSKSDTYEYLKEFVDMNLAGGSLLGKLVIADDDAAIQPYDYFPPANLRHVNLRINIPVGFRRLRRALLGQRQDFLRMAVYTESLGYTNITMIPWNKHSKSIGQLKLKKGEKWKDFLGAKRTISYFVPPSEAGDAHMAYESVELIEYNDFCFAIKSIIKNPDLPYGSEYETHYQIIVIDKGVNNIRMICSSETVVTGMKMEDDWQVRNAMRHRMTDYFYALCDAICKHAGSGEKKDQKDDGEGDVE